MGGAAKTADEIDRRRRVVLVMEAQALGMIGVIRSLGRAGYSVHAASQHADALGFHSRFAADRVRHPPYASREFVPWLDAYLRDRKISLLIPSEGFIHAIEGEYHRFEHLLPDSVPIAIWRRCLSKVSTQSTLLASDALEHMPLGGMIRTREDLADFSPSSLGAGPFYLKGDAGDCIDGHAATVRRCRSPGELRDAVSELAPKYRTLLWQRYVPGKKVGVSLWRHGEKFLAENMTIGIHMEPHTGGMMSLRRTFWHDALLADAKAKLTRLGWQGVAMMEYKWDPETDDFWFIEINARYWGYLHLDLYAGKDFPRLQADAFFGLAREDLGPSPRQVTCRNTIPGEVGYLVSLLKDREVGWPRKLRESVLFVLLFLAPGHKEDLRFPGDRSLYWTMWRRFLLDSLRLRRRRHQEAVGLPS
jgi:hypothetical protein